MKNEFTINYTNKDIMDKLNKIHDQTIITNGTVKQHTKQILAQKVLIYGCYAFIFTVITTTLIIVL